MLERHGAHDTTAIVRGYPTPHRPPAHWCRRDCRPDGRVEVAPQATTVERIDQRVESVETAAKRARLAALVSAPEVDRVIVFARTKRGADRVAQNLGKDGVSAEVTAALICQGCVKGHGFSGLRT